jgi:hypothetical protein
LPIPEGQPAPRAVDTPEPINTPKGDAPEAPIAAKPDAPEAPVTAKPDAPEVVAPKGDAPEVAPTPKKPGLVRRTAEAVKAEILEIRTCQIFCVLKPSGNRSAKRTANQLSINRQPLSG